ncbi:MAG: hypothetical protein P8130_14290 [Deltaproteobacteria bacterium]
MRHERGFQDHSRDKNWVMDRRYSHDRYYPRRGYRVRELPHGYREFHHHHERYFFYGGTWYRPYYDGFMVVTPPIGLTLSLLPPYYTTLWVNGEPYYYADGVYYRWLPQQRAYVVASPPPENEVVEDTSIPKSLYIYPKKGQSPAQQDTDRYECYRWAVKQTGFDPTQPGGNVPPDKNASMRGEYQRAMKACLEARDYSVQ